MNHAAQQPAGTRRESGDRELREQPVLTLIARIKSGEVPPGTLSADDRRRCVEVLRAEGYTLAEIAQILKRNERTIRRDIEQVREEHALAPDPRLAARLIGDLLRNAEISFSHLRRIAREPGASAMERLMAETSAWKVHRELFEKLQSVGYLPRMPAGIVAEFYERTEADAVPGFDELAQQLRDLEALAQATGSVDPDGVQRRRGLLEEVDRRRLASKVHALTPPVVGTPAGDGDSTE